MKTIFLTLLLSWHSYAADQSSLVSNNQCKAGKPLKIEEMKSVEDISSYFEKNKKNLTTIDDYVCCLPKEYLKNYLVGIASAAGQNGTPDGPRIIMFDTP